MKKRLLTILIVGVLMASITACGSTKTTEPTEEVISTEEVATEAVEEIETEIETETEIVELETETEEVVEAPAPIQTTMYAQKTVNVRALADANSDKLGTLSTNDPVVVVGDVANGWYTVTYCEKTGYIKAEYLGTGTVEVKATTAEKKTTVTTKSTSTGTSTTTNTNTATNTNTNTTASTPTDTSTPTATPSAEATPTATPAESTPTAPAQTEAGPTPEQLAAIAADAANRCSDTPQVNPDPLNVSQTW